MNDDREKAIREIIMFLSSQLAVAFRPQRQRALSLAEQHQLSAADLIQYRVDRFLQTPPIEVEPDDP